MAADPGTLEARRNDRSEADRPRDQARHRDPDAVGPSLRLMGLGRLRERRSAFGEAEAVRLGAGRRHLRKEVRVCLAAYETSPVCDRTSLPKKLRHSPVKANALMRAR